MSLTAEDFAQLAQDGLPATALQSDVPATQSLAQILSEAGAVQSGKQVKDALSSGSLLVNGTALDAAALMDARQVFSPDKSVHGKYFLVKIGKKAPSVFLA